LLLLHFCDSRTSRLFLLLPFKYEKGEQILAAPSFCSLFGFCSIEKGEQIGANLDLLPPNFKNIKFQFPTSVTKDLQTTPNNFKDITRIFLLVRIFYLIAFCICI
jgi:hypothetical protein